MPRVSRITSRQHAVVRRCRLAARRPESGEVLLDGIHLVEEAIRAGVALRAVLVRDLASTPLPAGVDDAGVDVYEGTDAVLAAASPVRQPSGIVALAAWRPASLDAVLAEADGPVLGLVDVQDPGNLGSAIRAADALDAAAVLALDATAHPGGWKALRGAMGSTFRIPVGRGTTADLLARTTARKVPLAATLPRGGHPPDAWHTAGAVIVLVGNEGAGLAPEIVDRADRRVSVPMRPGIESLNVAVCAALVLDGLRRARGRARRSAGPD